MPINGVTNATNVLVAGVTLQDLLNVRRIQGRTGDDPVGITVLIGEPLQPLGLAHRVGRIPPALDMHGFHHVLVAGVRPIVLQQVIPGNGPNVAFQARRQSAVLQPGIRIAPEVPKVMVRINCRLGVQHASRLPLYCRFRVAWSANTARITTTPVATSCQKDGTFSNVKPFCIAPNVSAPIREPNGLPSPPNRLAPPITAAPIACSSNPVPPIGSAAPTRPIRTKPARLASNPEVAYTQIFTRSMLMPESRAASSLP